MCWLISSREASNSSSSRCPQTLRSVVCASCEVANRKLTTSTMARRGSTTRKYSTALTFTETLSRVITSCGGTSMVTVRRSTRSMRSTSGMRYTIPGPRAPTKRPSRKTTPRSNSLRTLRPLNTITIATASTVDSGPSMLPPFSAVGPPAHAQAQTVHADHFDRIAHLERRLGVGVPVLAAHEHLDLSSRHDHPPYLADDTHHPLSADRR